jgi:hypothetical protein
LGILGDNGGKRHEGKIIRVQLVRLQLAKIPAFFAVSVFGESQKPRVFEGPVELPVAPKSL